MNKAQFIEMFNNEKNNFWFRGKRMLVYRMLQKFAKNHKTVFDVGCGTGMTLIELAKRGYSVSGADISKDAVLFSKSRGVKKVYHLDLSRSYLKQKFDCILALDVLEHIKNESAALKNIHKMMHNESKLIITVPAYKFLWSKHDVALHHFRRYSKKQFMSGLESAGFHVIKCSYCYASIFLPTLFLRLFQNKFDKKTTPFETEEVIHLPYVLNELGLLMLYLENLLLTNFNLPFGVSIMCIAEKND